MVAFSNGKAHENCVDENGCYILVNSKFVSTKGSVIKKVTLQLSPLFKSQFVMVMSDLPNGKALAKCFYIEKDNIYTLNQRICSFTAQNGNVSRFLMYQINRNKYYLRYDDGINQTNLKKGEVLACPVFIPSIQEQTKIATFIHLLDKRIATQTKIIEDLKKLKSAIIEKLFCSPKNKQPEVRLHGFSDNWQIIRLSEICHRIRCKNTEEQCKRVLTIAAQYGLVSQEEFFNKNVASENLSGYYLLQNGDFAYNKSYSGDYVWGTVKRLDNYEQGVLSPLYICFRPDSAKVDSDFLVYYFESKKWHKAVADIAGEGARNHGLLNISVIDYFNTIHCIPSMDEQKQIAQIMSALLSKIAREQRMLNCYTTQRQYLLRQMFI